MITLCIQYPISFKLDSYDTRLEIIIPRILGLWAHGMVISYEKTSKQRKESLENQSNMLKVQVQSCKMTLKPFKMCNIALKYPTETSSTILLLDLNQNKKYQC